MRLVLRATLLTTALALMACGAVDERKASALRTLAGSAFAPIVSAQSKAALTQGAYTSDSLVAPRRQVRAAVVTPPAPARRHASPGVERVDLPLATADIDFATLTPASQRRLLRGRVMTVYAIAREHHVTRASDATELARCILKQPEAAPLSADPLAQSAGAS